MQEPSTSRRRFGDHLHDRVGNERMELVYETLTGALFLSNLAPQFAVDLRESARHARHAGLTVTDFARGGPAGERGANHLEEALATLQAASGSNEEAARELQRYQQARQGFAEELGQIYQRNETIAEVAGRLSMQLKGTAKNLFDAGNDIKPDSWKAQIDRPIILTYGKALRALGNKEYEGLSDDQIIIHAMENSGKLMDFYRNVREFYDAREKNEGTIGQFCDYLGKVQSESRSQNQEIEQLFPDAIARVRETYGLEHKLLETDAKGVRMERGEIAEGKKEVHDYQGRVDETAQGISTTTGLPVVDSGFFHNHWAEIAINPVTLALGGVAVVKGLRKMALTNGLDRGLAGVVCYVPRKLMNIPGAVYDILTHSKDIKAKEP